MYVIRKQKMTKTKDADGKTVYAPARAYTVDEYETMGDYLDGITDTAQFRVRGWKYRLMDVTEGDDVTARFEWSPSSPTE